MITETSSISECKGVGEERKKKFQKIGVNTALDLLYYFPRAYENRGDVRLLTDAPEDIPCSFLLTVATEVSTAQIRSGMTLSKFRAFDESTSVSIIFFNAPFIKQVFHVGGTFRFFGKVEKKKRSLFLTSPKYEPFTEGKVLSDLIPVYPQTEGLSSKVISTVMAEVCKDLLPQVKETLPVDVSCRYSLSSLSYALREVHMPENAQSLTRAMKRLAFDELFYFALGISSSIQQKKKALGVSFQHVSLEPLFSLLPYDLTNDQKNAINDIVRDTSTPDVEGKISPMSRILVGDVGSGKTICAIVALYLAAKSGFQSALMAPTEILARQHYQDISALFDVLHIPCVLLLGSTTAKDKKLIRSGLQNGDISVVIGTHALLSDDVDFSNLGLVVTDEQHRFGVAQRATLKEKSGYAHMLVMSATPIPRSLSLAMYGDLDVSRIVEMPKGRQRVDTYVVDDSYRDRLQNFIRKQVADGGQCYIVCPAIESGSKEDEIVPCGLSEEFFEQKSNAKLKSALDYTQNLKKLFSNMRIECLHGKMAGKEKDAIMSAFVNGQIQVLVSTTVIEVGVNVPNATLMIVEDADRFGLAQLHQLRGRVGRGRKKSYCVLVSNAKTDLANERLQIMKTTYDGYEIAQKDLLLRGPGDFFASSETVRQSGGFTFRYASLSKDTGLLDQAFRAAKELMSADPGLSSPDHIYLRQRMETVCHLTPSTIS